MCLLERQTPSFSPPGVWDRLQAVLELEQTGHSRRAAKACACPPAASLVGEEAPNQSNHHGFVNILRCSCIRHEQPIEALEDYNHILYQIVICI